MACESAELCLTKQYLITIKPKMDNNDYDNILK